jgi:hypothetical protein
MNKNISLSERIADAVKKKPTLSRSVQNRAAFIILRTDIKQALDDGWTVKRIWETLCEEGKIDFGYTAFVGYTNRLILSPLPNNSANQAPVSTRQVDRRSEQKTPGAGEARAAEPKKTETPTMGGFTFNPSPKKEDLI